VLPTTSESTEDESMLATTNFLGDSSIRALKASSVSSRGFDKFLFIELNRSANKELDLIIKTEFSSLADRVTLVRSDANAALGR